MLLRPFFTPASSTYTYLIACESGREDVLIGVAIYLYGGFVAGGGDYGIADFGPTSSGTTRFGVQQQSCHLSSKCAAGLSAALPAWK